MAAATSLAVNVSASGALIAAPASATQRIKVKHCLLMAAGAVSVTLKSGTKAVLGPVPAGGAGGGFAIGNGGNNVLVCNPGEALNITLSSGVQVGGTILYVVE